MKSHVGSAEIADERCVGHSSSFPGSQRLTVPDHDLQEDSSLHEENEEVSSVKIP